MIWIIGATLIVVGLLAFLAALMQSNIEAPQPTRAETWTAHAGAVLIIGGLLLIGWNGLHVLYGIVAPHIGV